MHIPASNCTVCDYYIHLLCCQSCVKSYWSEIALNSCIFNILYNAELHYTL